MTKFKANCCLELERIFYSISLNEKLVSNMTRFLFQSVICSVIIACTLWTLKALKTFAWSVVLVGSPLGRKKGWSLEGLFFAILRRQLSIFVFWTFAFHLWILALLSLTYKRGRINNFLEFALKWIFFTVLITFSACVEGVPLEIRLGDERDGNKVTLT